MMSENPSSEGGWNFANSYSQLPSRFFSLVEPTPVKKPALVVFNSPLADDLGIGGDALQSEEGISILAGNRIPPGAMPLAQAYAGHQFGHFTKLGDGRAILLGEQLTPKGERYDIQLKGSGETPYSRRGDGRAALGPMLREYIISEAMYALGIPTTRSLAVVTTGEQVYREKVLPGAILTRVAASHIRVGTFEYAARWASLEEFKALADYTLERHYPGIESENPYLYLLQEAARRQAKLIAQWQLVGFIHGVMNTDNMVLSGETIDYGPCAFMDTYNSETVFSSIDTYGRYAYCNQPHIANWNLARLAETLIPLLHEDQEQALALAQEVITDFPAQFKEFWLTGMRSKLGLATREEQDETLIEDLLKLMEEHKADFTNTFRALTLGRLSGLEVFAVPEFQQWHQRWQARVDRQGLPREAAQRIMMASNPAIIPRNYQVEEDLAAAEQGELSVMKRLIEVMSKPYAYSETQEEYALPPGPSSCRYRTFCGT
jgi:uncharacterized protein YdiU (UPF0061 family)